jgi:hypothetical protein
VITWSSWLDRLSHQLDLLWGAEFDRLEHRYPTKISLRRGLCVHYARHHDVSKNSGYSEESNERLNPVSSSFRHPRPPRLSRLVRTPARKTLYQRHRAGTSALGARHPGFTTQVTYALRGLHDACRAGRSSGVTLAVA